MSRSANPPTRIFLVRHGTAEGADGLVVGQIDLPLATSGADDLRRLATTWKGPAPDRLLSSDLARAASSADLLGETWDLPVSERDPRLREMDFGAWDGETWDDLRKNHGETLDRWMGRWWQEPAPGGESLGDVDRRAKRWLDQTLADFPGETIVAVAHGGSIRTLLGQALHLPLEKVFHLRLDHGKVSCLATSGRGLEVLFTNADCFPGSALDS